MTAYHSQLFKITYQLLQDISYNTFKRFQGHPHYFICANCLCQFQPQKIYMSGLQEVAYIGCRNCQQSRDYLECQAVIACLDNREEQEQWLFQDQTLQVNWLIRRDLFDFDSVKIIRATDEEVERFAIQVGNDTDPFRMLHYGRMECLVLAECPLSENSLRILRRIFGPVEIG